MSDLKTEDLIRALAADLTPVRATIRRTGAGALALGALVAALAFFAFIGPRADLAAALHSLRFLMKFAVTLALSAAAAGLLLRLAAPDLPAGRWRAAILAAPAFLVGAVAVELFVLPPGDWRSNLVGANATACLTLIPLLAIGPLACLLIALRRGAPAQPGLAGAVAGLAAGGVAATLYAAHCTNDSPLFVAVWYTLAIAAVALAGYALGARLLRW
jgi:hypothetical protein